MKQSLVNIHELTMNRITTNMDWWAFNTNYYTAIFLLYISILLNTCQVKIAIIANIMFFLKISYMWYKYIGPKEK